jgi:hypothetical protein
MGRTVLAGLFVLLLADPAAAQFRRPLASPSEATRYLPPPRYPRLAAFAQPAGVVRPGYVLPGVHNQRPLARVLPWVVQGALLVMSFVDFTPLTAVGNAGPPAIRAAHVLLNGTPTPGQPLQTALFIANPWAAEVRARMSWRGARCCGR